MKPRVTLYALTNETLNLRLRGVFGKLRSEFARSATWMTVNVTKENSAEIYSTGIKHLPCIAISVGHRLVAQTQYVVQAYPTIHNALTDLCSPSPSSPRNGALHAKA